MRKKLAKAVVRRVNGPRKSTAHHIRIRAPLTFLAIVLVSAVMAFWLNDRYQKTETIYRAYRQSHPLKAGEKPPRVDWLTGRVWH